MTSCSHFYFLGNGVLVQQAMQQSYARQTGAVPNHGGGGHHPGQGGSTRVKWGQETNDDEFEEVQVRGLDGGYVNQYPKGAGPGMGGGTGLPNITQPKPHPGHPGGGGHHQGNGHINGAKGPINYHHGSSVSPPDRGRSPSAGAHGRTDWKAKYLK